MIDRTPWRAMGCRTYRPVDRFTARDGQRRSVDSRPQTGRSDRAARPSRWTVRPAVDGGGRGLGCCPHGPPPAANRMLATMKHRSGQTAAILVASVSASAAGSAELAPRTHYPHAPQIAWSAQWREHEFIRPRQDTRLLAMLTRRITGPSGNGMTMADRRRGQLTPWSESGRGD